MQGIVPAEHAPGVSAPESTTVDAELGAVLVQPTIDNTIAILHIARS